MGSIRFVQYLRLALDNTVFKLYPCRLFISQARILDQVIVKGRNLFYYQQGSAQGLWYQCLSQGRHTYQFRLISPLPILHATTSDHITKTNQKYHLREMLAWRECCNTGKKEQCGVLQMTFSVHLGCLLLQSEEAHFDHSHLFWRS